MDKAKDALVLWFLYWLDYCKRSTTLSTHIRSNFRSNTFAATANISAKLYNNINLQRKSRLLAGSWIIFFHKLVQYNIRNFLVKTKTTLPLPLMLLMPPLHLLLMTPVPSLPLMPPLLLSRLHSATNYQTLSDQDFILKQHFTSNPQSTLKPQSVHRSESTSRSLTLLNP